MEGEKEFKIIVTAFNDPVVCVAERELVKATPCNHCGLKKLFFQEEDIRARNSEKTPILWVYDERGHSIKCVCHSCGKKTPISFHFVLEGQPNICANMRAQ